MLKELFEAYFYGTFPKLENKVLMLDERTVTGDFSLIDPNACFGCKYVCSEVSEQREQLKVHADQSVSIISIDQVFIDLYVESVTTSNILTIILQFLINKSVRSVLSV